MSVIHFVRDLRGAIRRERGPVELGKREAASRGIAEGWLARATW
jgi:hypothetical protein